MLTKYFLIVRIAVVLPWFTFLFTLLASVNLFVASSSRVARIDQAHEETYAQSEVQKGKVSTMDRAGPVLEKT